MKIRPSVLVERPTLGFAVIAAAVLIACAPALGHAFFDLDDYRYLLEVRQIQGGLPGAWRSALVVENRWDDAWWLPEGTYVRFFRPLVIVFYWLDAHLWGEGPFGYVLTNVLLHVAATGLLYSCLLRLFGRRWAAFAGALAFGVHGSHWENLAYVAGRTDTLAAIPLLGAVLAHLVSYDRPSFWGKLLVPACCFVAFLGKEYTIILPGLLLLIEWPRHPEGQADRPGLLRRNLVPLVASVVALAVYFALRNAALGAAGSGSRPFPYFFLPDRDGFYARTGAALLQYAQGLAFGDLVLPFLNDARALEGQPVLLALSALWVVSLVAWGFLETEGRWFSILFVATLLPMLVLYTSGRYLYIPSIGYCALLGLAIERCARLGGRIAARLGDARAGLLLSAALAALFIVIPAVRLGATSGRVVSRYKLGLERPAIQALLAAPIDFKSPGPIHLVDFPGDWFEMQFASAAVAVARQVPPPALVFLTTRPRPASAGATARPVDDRTLELSRGGAPLVAHDPLADFDTAKLPASASVRRRGYTVTVTASAADLPARALVHLDVPLAAVQLHGFPPAVMAALGADP